MIVSQPGIHPFRPTSEPTWEIARLFPDQGSWCEEEYLNMDTNRLLEYSHGYLEVLPMPTDMHQAILAFLFELLQGFVKNKGLGTVRFAALPVRLWEGKFREPDLMFLLAKNMEKRNKKFWDGADLVMEVVSDENRRHDLETKRFEYAKAGIPEYWIVDPRKAQMTVLRLDGGRYVEHGTFSKRQKATSVLLPGFCVDVAEALRAE